MSGGGVVIVGAGAIGCGIARALAMEGVRATVVDPDEPGAHASSAAAGMLAPLVEANEPNAFLSLLRESSAAFPAFAAALLDETGIDVAVRDEGTLLLALTEADVELLERRFAWQTEAQLPVERLSGDEARALEPQVSPEVRLALRFPEDHQVDSRLLSRALAASAEKHGAVLRRGRVAAVRAGAGRVAGVTLDDGEWLDAEHVVIAAGCWSGRIRGLPRPVPVRPVHGQLVALDATRVTLAHVIDSPRIYLVPRRDGRVVVGATAEEIGYETRVTEAATGQLLRAAAEAVPALARAPILESWSGLRPGTPDDLPILGRDPEVQGLHYATGHYRNGILLAPLTATILRDSVMGRPARDDVSAFSISRF